MVQFHRFQASYLHAATRQLLMALETPRHIADDVAEILIHANLTGHDSHGVIRLPAYLRAIEAGQLKPAAEPTVLEETSTTVRIDGNHGFGHYTARKGMALGIKKAKEANICAVSFSNTGHIGRVGHYAEDAARAGCIGMITVGLGDLSRGYVVPHGGIRGAMSTNPIAVGVPTGDEVPFILDFATSVVAEGKIQVARSKNLDVPAGYILDNEGVPTVKTSDFYNGGFLLPVGKHKGYALALMCCLLGGLSGGFNPEAGSVKGEFMQVWNIEAFMPLTDYQRGVRAFLDQVKTIPPAPDIEEVLVPGDVEHQSRVKNLREGIEVPETVYQQMQEWADRLNISIEPSVVDEQDQARYA